jgi:hypothetical protein
MLRRNQVVQKLALTQGKESLVDDEWFPILSQWKWYYNGAYATRDIGTRKGRQSIFLHRYILMAPDEYHVDHINQDKLDNRRENLRLVTPEKNYINRRMLSNNKTGYKGVAFDKTRGKYIVSISLNKKQHNLGRFDTAFEAAKAYNEAAKKLHGEYAFLNQL